MTEHGHLTNATEPICLPDEGRVGPLGPVGRKMDFTQTCLEISKSSSEIQPLKLRRFRRIDLHHILCVDKYQAVVKCSMICWRERKPIPNLIRAAGSCDRKNVGGFDQSKLHSCDSAAMTICIEDSFSEISVM